MTEVTLEAYEQAERALKMRDAKAGITWHAVVTVVVWVVIIPVNIFVAPGFPWSLFVVGGMALGLFFHWFAYRHAEEDIDKQQALVEAHARTMS